MKNIMLITLLAIGLTAFSQVPPTYVSLDTEAKPLNLKSVTDQIQYPEDLAVMRQEGTVVFRVLVDQNGTYRNHQATSSSNPRFTAAAEAQIPKLNFSPALQDGKPVTSWVFVPVKFKLAESYARR